VTWLETLTGWIRATSGWELTAVALALAYLLLAVRRSLWCWPCAFASTSIYLVVFASAGLYMQSILQVYYLVMAVYGYLEWQRGGAASGQMLIATWPLRRHLLVGAVVLAAAFANGWVLSRWSAAAQPFVDSFVTWASVVTTWMVARRVLENWLYWFVIDGVAAGLYLSQGLMATALLFVVYMVIVVRGFLSWRRELHGQLHAIRIGAPRAAQAAEHGTG